jgi:hemoglobin-like flavoprotein
MLSKSIISIVQSDWAKAVPIADQAATLFYDRLFTLDPSLRPLFKPDLTEQKTKLMKMIGAAVNGLDDLPALVPVVQALGRRHVGYGVKPEHYVTVGSALLWTLKQGLGDAFGRENETAWTQVYGLLADTMKESAEPARAMGPAE